MAEPVRFQHFEVPLRDDGSLFELGRGAMGITYKAFDTNLRCFVALKVINAAYLGSDVAKQRFLREARAAAALRHPNVATVFHLGEEGGNCFYAMEFVEGETVEALMKRGGAIPADAALEIGLQVARALGAAQKQGLVHRDIKPSNLMLVRDDEGELTVKVIDFGLAKSTAGGAEETAALTVSGFLGTPHFASPEQLEERDLDVRSDIYSLGVTLYYMLAGRAPFSGSLAQVMSQHLHREPPLERLASQHPMVLDLLRHMLAKDAAARPQTPLDLRHEMEACLAAVRAAPAAAPALPVDPENFETQALVAVEDSSVVELVAGAVLAGRYRLLHEASASDLGRIFKVEPVGSAATSAVLAVLVPDPASVASAEALTRLENQVLALRKVSDPALQKIFSLERVGPVSFLTLEWVEGPSLLDLMRARRVLPQAEAMPIIRRMASAFDALQASGAACPDIASHEVILPGTDPALPIGEGVVVMFNALTADAPGASPDMTVVASAFAMVRDSGGFSAGEPRAYVYSLAAVAYELLGGIRSGSSSGTPVPIAGLSETSNLALRRALNLGAAPFPSCAGFLDALEGREIDEPEAATAPEIPWQAPPPDIIVPPVILPPPAEAPRWFLRPGVWFAAVALVAVSAGGWIILTPAPVVVVALPPTATPVPTPVPTPTPDPVESKLHGLLADSSASPATTLEALLALDCAHPARQDVRDAIATWLTALAGKSKTLAPAEAALLQAPLEAAAPEFPEAAIVLGNLSKATEPAAALKWFLIAAGQDRADAMVQSGKIYANGTGLPAKDNPSAVKWFQQAAALGDPMGQFLLADCYIYGVGVGKDPARALKLLQASSAKNNPLAMNRLGDIYKNGIQNVLSPDPKEAARLFSAAMDLGNLDAQGNLGTLVLSEDDDAVRAGELFKGGAEKDNPLCMFYYAMALEDGLGNISADKAQAREWFIRSARLGHPPAVEWCKKNGVAL